MSVNSKGYSWVIALLGCMLLSSLWLFVWQQVEYERKETMKDAARENLNLAKAFEEQVRSLIAHVDYDMVTIKLAYEREGVSSPVVAAVLERTLQDAARFHIGIANERGRFVVSTHARALAFDYSDRAWFVHSREMKKDALHIGLTDVSKVSGKFVIPLCRRIIKPDGTFGGVVHASIDTGYFSSVLSQLELGSSGMIGLSGMDGILRFRQSQDSQVRGQDIRGGDIWKQVQLKPTGSVIASSPLDGVERLQTYRVMQDYPLFVVVATATQTVLEAFEQRKKYYIWGAAGISCILMVICFLLIDRNRKQKELAERLRDSQARYQALMERSFEALALVDIKIREVVEVNRRFSELFGYSLPLDAPLYLSKIAPDMQSNLDMLSNAMATQPGGIPLEAKVYHHKNSAEIFVERAGTIINLDGRDFLLISNRDMRAERRRQEELAREFEMARQVQQGLLPDMSDSPLVEIQTLYYPSNSVSGDSYHLEWLNEMKLLRGFLIDVSGHGLGTALQTASVNVLLHETSTTELTLLEQMDQVALRASRYFVEGSYAAMIGFELDFSAMELSYVGAGITQLYANGRRILSPGMFIGLWEGVEFTRGTVPIAAGDCFHFLTDGFTDALAQPQDASFWSPGGKDFEADVAALERLAESGMLRDDATGVCFKIMDVMRQEKAVPKTLG